MARCRQEGIRRAGAVRSLPAYAVVELRYGNGSEPFQAPFRAGVRIDAYQLDPLWKALRLPRVNLFIADDVGLRPGRARCIQNCAISTMFLFS